MHNRECLIYSRVFHALIYNELAIISKRAQVICRYLDDCGRQARGASFTHEFISEDKDAVGVCSRCSSCIREDQTVSLVIRWNSSKVFFEKEVLVDDSWPIGSETESSVLFRLYLFCHEPACGTKRREVVPSIYKPLRYLPTIVSILFQNLVKWTLLLRVVSLHLVVHVKSSSRFVLLGIIGVSTLIRCLNHWIKFKICISKFKLTSIY